MGQQSPQSDLWSAGIQESKRLRAEKGGRYLGRLRWG